MKASEKSLSFLATEGSIKIPFFQRGYVWNKTNWKDLLEELIDTKKNAFLGSLILKQQPAITGLPKQVLVIDGQQRLTTLSILLKSLYDSFDESKKAVSKNTLYHMLYYKANPFDENDLIKISHSHIDASFYEKIMRGTITTEEYNRITVADPEKGIRSIDSKILQCYKYFLEIFKNTEESIKLDLFARLLDGNKKIIVGIDLEDYEDEQAIFDTINSAGVRLSGADIVKNALFQKAISLYSDEDKVIKLYKEYWESTFSNDVDSIRFWEATRITGRLVRDNIEILLHSIAVIKSFFDPDGNTLSDIPNLYKSYITKLDSKDKLIAFLKEIHCYAKLYRTKILQFDNTTLFEYDNYEQRMFHILNRCEISTFHPYILYVYYNSEANNVLPKDELIKLEKFIIRNMIVKGETKSYNKLCKEFIYNPNLLDIKLSEIDNNKIFNGLLNIPNKEAALILFWVELKRRYDDTRESLKELKYSYSLEHIMPQKWEEYWNKEQVPYVNDQGKPTLNDEIGYTERKKAVYSIGNMTLLNSSLNTSLRNYELCRKIEGEGRKKGIRAYADLKITKEDLLIPYDSGYNIWNEQTIALRTQKLFNEIISLW